jgi:hypothetical protein
MTKRYHSYVRSSNPDTIMAHRNGRLEGESDGRTMGRVEERSRIVAWLRDRDDTPSHRLAIMIEHGCHTKI